MEMPNWIKPAIWGVVVGALGWWIVLASVFGWKSPDAVTKISAQRTQDAIVAYATPACVARFEKQPNAVAAWETLNKTEHWMRSDLVMKEGWVAEPNQKLDPFVANAVASACAPEILALKTLAGVQLRPK